MCDLANTLELRHGKHHDIFRARCLHPFFLGEVRRLLILVTGLSRIKLKFNGLFVIVDPKPPDHAIPEIIYQFTVLRQSHVACPYYFCSIDVSVIEYPLIVKRMVWTILHEYKMLVVSSL